MSYATYAHVSELNLNRPAFTASTSPNLTQVGRYLDATEAEIDGILLARGYVLPVPTTATSALALLTQGNALGAAMMVEQSAKVSDRRDQALSLYREFKRALKEDDLVGLDLPLDPTRSEVSTGYGASPMF